MPNFFNIGEMKLHSRSLLGLGIPLKGCMVGGTVEWAADYQLVAISRKALR